MDYVMVKENIFGKIPLTMKGIGWMIKLKEKENYIMLMVIYMKGNGKTTWLLDMGLIFIQEEQNMRESGKMISKTVRELKFGQRELVMKESTWTEKRLEKEHLNLQMGLSTKANFTIMRLAGLESISGKTGKYIKVSGSLIRWMEKALLYGLMVKNMMDSIWTTKSTAMEYLNGETEKSTKENGSMENSMGKE